MNLIRECKQDRREVHDIDQRIARLIKDVAETACNLRSRNIQRDDEDLGIAYDHYQDLVNQLKEARQRTCQHGRLTHHFNARLVTLKARRPSFFDRVFRRQRLKGVQA